MDIADPACRSCERFKSYSGEKVPEGLDVQGDQDTEAETVYKALERAPADIRAQKGLSITLTARDLGGLWASATLESEDF